MMNKSFVFGINLYIEDTDYLEEAIQSIVINEALFIMNVNLVLIDAIETNESKAICNKYIKMYKQNICYLPAIGMNKAQCYNEGMKVCNSKYMNFSLSSTIFGKQTFSEILKYLKKTNDDIIAMHTKFYDAEIGIKGQIHKKEKKYDLKETLFYLPLFLNRYFISSDLAKAYNFDGSLYDDCGKAFLIHCFSNQSVITLVKNTAIYYSEAQERNVTRYSIPTKRWWYIQQMREMILPLLKKYQTDGKVPKHIQNLVLYLIEIKFYFNKDMKYKYIIRKDEIDEFIHLVRESLAFIDDDIIVGSKNKAIAPMYFCYILLKIKRGKDELYPTFKALEDGQVYATIDQSPITPVKDILVSLQSFTKDEDTKDKIVKAELFYNYLFDEDKLDLEVEVNGVKSTFEMDENNVEVKYFGKVMRKKYIFYIRIPKEHQRLHNRLRFSMTIDNEKTIIKGKLAKRKILGAYKRKIKNGRLCPILQYARQYQYIFLYLWYRMTCKQQPNDVLMLSDSRAELSGNLAFIDEELRNKGFHIQYFFKRTLKEVKTRADKKHMCKLMASSKYILVDDFYPIIYALPLRKGTKLIQVWHAMGAFKTVGFSRLGKPGGPNPRSITHRNYTATITSADGIRVNYAEAFQMPLEDVYATGIPRTDIFFDSEYVKNTKDRLYNKYPQLIGKKVIMFAPTFRGNGQNSAYYNFDWIDFDELQIALKGEYIFIIKLHPFIKNIDSVPKDNDFYLDLTAEREINDLLFITDVLITDYSSVIFEASLLNINTIFYVPDLQIYTESRDFYYPFDHYTFGKIAENLDSLIKAIKNPQNDAKKLEKFKEHFCGSCDGKATKRFVDTLFDVEKN